MNKLKKDNLVNKIPSDMHGGDGIRFTEDQKAMKERKEDNNIDKNKNLKADKLKNEKPTK